MTSNSTLMVHCGGVRRTRDGLRGLHTPSPTATWRPIPHLELVSELIGGLEAHGVQVVREAYCTLGRDDARLLGTMDLRIPDLDTPDFGMGLGLRAGNDRSCAVQFVAAARVFLCDNWAFSGSDGAVFLKRKHTARLDIRAIIPGAIDQFLERAGAFRHDIDRMRGFPLSDCSAKAILLDAFTGPAPVLPLRCLPAVRRLYFDDEVQRDRFSERTLWSLNQAFTEAVKTLRPAPQQASGLRIGRLFGNLLHRARPEAVSGLEIDT